MSLMLQDICELIADCPHSTAKDEGAGYPLIRTPNIGKGRLILEGVHRVSQEVYDKRNLRAVPRAGDIIFAREAPAGNAALIMEGQEVCLGQRTVLIRPNPDLVYPPFLVYYILAPEQQYKLLGGANGATVAHINLPIIRKMPVELPKMAIQIKIADILSAYDNLIENNQKQIMLLEEAAQRLYREWFVDFRFPGHEQVQIINGVPAGWKKVALKELIEKEIGGGWGEDTIKDKHEYPAYVVRGTDLNGLLHGNIKDIPYRYHAKSNLGSRELCDGDIIFEVSGGGKTEGAARTLLIRDELLECYDAPVMCASFCKLIRFKNKAFSQYMYDTFQYLRSSGKTAEYDKRSASSIVNYRWKDFLIQQEIFLPSDKILFLYNSIAENLFYQILTKSKMIEELSHARNRLLPKLMSGEITL